MIEGTLAAAAHIMNGTLLGSDGSYAGVSTDSRTLGQGELFFALQGPNFDGGAFVSAAAEKNAAAAVLCEAVDVDIPQITVDDTRLALGTLAASWRQRMPAKVIGITGSNGKTTVKAILANCLSLSAETLATRGNLNNDIGMPLMLLSLSENHRYAVIEMGANHSGEIAYLTSLSRPDVVMITNAAPAHLEGFGDLDGVASAKGEILQDDVSPVFVVLNADDPYFAYWNSLLSGDTVISFGIEANASVFATDVEADGDLMIFNLHIHAEEIPIRLPLAGMHNVSNACAAAAVLHGLGMDSKQIRQGLESVQAVSGRLQPVERITSVTVYDDSYNANPQSVIAAAEFLAAQPGHNWLVLGDMGELGEDEVLLHKAVGRAAKRLGIDRILATGKLSKNTVKTFGNGAQWYENIDGLVAELQRTATEDTNILIKGSRFMEMERVVEALINEPPTKRKA